uniref:Uncharacterized protein n=1 Tax=Picea glauca TaxID=3330 RepID=A0A101LTL7_PICGL|nr:hypothetical protein ABT39_MTgene4048 [Picea glauca]
MVAFDRRSLQRESCEWPHGKMCCTTIQLVVTTTPTEFICQMQNTANMFPSTC